MSDPNYKREQAQIRPNKTKAFSFDKEECGYVGTSNEMLYDSFGQYHHFAGL